MREHIPKNTGLAPETYRRVHALARCAPALTAAAEYAEHEGALRCALCDAPCDQAVRPVYTNCALQPRLALARLRSQAFERSLTPFDPYEREFIRKHLFGGRLQKDLRLPLSATTMKMIKQEFLVRLAKHLGEL